MKCGISYIKFKVRTGKCKVWSVESSPECRVKSVQCKEVWGVECKVWSLECEV